jgi:Cft2 family RNA processing exonuclease
MTARIALKKLSIKSSLNLEMNNYIKFLGGCEEIGANSCYLYLDGTGMLIDAGLHPKLRNKNAFPFFEEIIDNPLDFLLLTHAHTDHIGAIPYLLRYHPQVKIIATRQTRDLLEIMLNDTSKLLRSNVSIEFPQDMLQLYKAETLELISKIVWGEKYNINLQLRGKLGRCDLEVTFFQAGHILGAASIAIKIMGHTLYHTGDINFNKQAVIGAAKPINHHLDCLITESTNAGNELIPDYESEIKRFAKYINNIVNKNGSILIPAFALGKTQEVLKILYKLMRKGAIPNIPIYTGGMSRRISNLHDKYCYSEEMLNQGFEISDIGQEPLIREELFSAKYFDEPSIVVAASGMMSKGTYSYLLAKKWLTNSRFGIAFVGYLDEDSPAYTISCAQPQDEILFDSQKIRMQCDIEKFRFTSHALFNDLFSFIKDTTPSKLFVIHGDTNASETLALKVLEEIPQTTTNIPKILKEYELF